MKNWKLPLIVAAGAVAYYFIGLKKSLENARVTLFGVKYNSKKSLESFFTKIYLDITLKIENPNSQAITVNEINLNFFHDQTQIGTAKRLDPIKIAGKNETLIQFDTHVNTLAVFTLVQDAIKYIRDKKPFNISAKGIVNVDGNRIKVDESKSVTW